MKDQFVKLLSLQADHKNQVRFLLFIIALLYFYNFHINDIWTPNESFYAESVREMFETGNFIDIKYNYEPRYNKPPLTYWAIALSASVFGLNEFGIRLPIVLMTLGSVWLTYLLGKKLYGSRGGLYSMIIMAVSVQLMAVKQYASPEIPLTFFFTLTLYWFLKAYKDGKTNYYYLTYIALGLTVLTKGYPYIIVIGGIIGFYILLDSGFRLKVYTQRLGKLKLHFGIPIVLIIGLSWVIYMYLTYGSDFWEIFQRETFERAFTRNEKSMRPFFYFGVISWSILPYSLAFFAALVYYLFYYRKVREEIAFPFSWFLVMLLVFSAAKGKIPTYFIQAHPAMALIITSILINHSTNFKKTFGYIWSFCFGIPSVLLGLASFATIYLLQMHFLWYLVPLLVLVICLYTLNNNNINRQEKLIIIPFWVSFSIYFLVAGHLPSLEKFRPYDELGAVISSSTEIYDDTPIMIEATLIHNIPFYAKRKAIRDQTTSQIQQHKGKTLALVREESLNELTGFKTLWSGLIYDFPSESQFAKFIKACIDAENGDFSKFAKYTLVYKN